MAFFGKPQASPAEGGGSGYERVFIKDSFGTTINPASEETLQAVLSAQGGSVYNFIQSEEAGSYKYYGFASATGWKFKRKNVSSGVWTVSDGAGNYDTNWADKANKTYTYV